ncbi:MULTISPECIES: Na+/H+ antiporter [Actinoalloteichus]|uniref:Na+ antiporter n=1 Tax=Actinoalloteichus fjordicus TaxID=1612552 RepID=A0AAC9LC02_9PSEU|nr:MULTISPECIES: Na+/H+ antiporter [Actinoalloteichus]APU13630.1 Na+ antiporter [Actinoalloteichus fjordicus]APU19576.1 Na+ antiporter [Actinoalloteichus sp. GBA129-24]
MGGLELTVVLGITVLAGAVLAPRLRVAVPLLLLLVFGVVLGFVPALREVELPPETVLLLFLPVMLFWESLTTSLRSIRRDFRGIVLMSTVLVVATAFAVAGVAHLLGMPWQAALILGAAVAPPDATAVAALGRTLPHRNFMLLKAESLTNDGTALVLYAIAVGVAAGGHYTPLAVTGMVLLSYLGGVMAGAVVAGAAYLVMRRLRDSTVINIALLLVPFTAFLSAELIEASGVLAVVVAGLLVAFVAPRISTAASRRQTESAWPLGAYLLNGALFVLIGLEVNVVSRQMDVARIGWALTVIVAVWLTLFVVRFLFQVVSVSLIRLLDRRPSQRTRRMSHRARVVSAVAGFRGAVSLAIALSVPVTLDDGEAFPGRDEIVFATAGVIVLTLLVQGPLLPVVVRWARPRLPDDSAAEDELRIAEHAITTAAVAALPDLAVEHGISAEVHDRLARDYHEHLDLIDARANRSSDTTVGPGPEPAEIVPDGGEAVSAAPQPVQADSPLTRNEEYTRLRLATLDRKRAVLIRLRREGVIDDAVARQIQTRLDIEELRLTGTEPLG